MKNILYIFPEMNFGGAEKAALLVSEELFERYEYRIFFFFLNKKGKDISLNPNFFVIFNNEGILSKKNNYSELFILTPIKIIKAIKKYKIDYIISGYEYDIESILIITRLFYWNRNVKFVSILQASLKGRISEVSSRRKILFMIVDYLRSYFFNGIIAVSRSIIEELKNSAKKKAIVIPNPLDKKIDELMVLTKDNIIQEILANQPYILNVSRISVQKNLLLLLKSFNLIKEIIPHNLLIIGSISDIRVKAELNDYIELNHLSKRVYLFSPIENIYPVINNASAIVFTSLYEGLPLFILESMYLKKIIVSTKYIGYDAILKDDNSFLCEDFTEDKFSKLILLVLEGQNLTKQKVFIAYNNSLLYSQNIIAKNYHDYLLKVK